MTERDSSQESLPLSQETYLSLLSALGPTSNEMIPFNAQDWANVPSPSMQYVGELESALQPPLPMVNAASLPAVTDWPGNYSFKLFIESKEPLSKQSSFVYSKAVNKLYIKKDAVCPINFSASVPITKNISVRAMAVFSEPKDVNEIVTRCINHSMEEINKGYFEAEHLVRCESAQACYNTDLVTKRHSVCVPFERPPVGQTFSTYLYKFPCYSSCSGGPNRRPITLVFTLQEGGNVVGRQTLDLKVCACPYRDKKNDEPSPAEIPPEPQLDSPPTKKVKLMNKPPVALHQKTMDDRAFNFAPKPKKENLYVKADDPEMHKFLLQMKRFYILQRTCSHFFKKTGTQYLCLIRSSDEEEGKGYSS